MAEVYMSNTLKEREGVKTNVKPAGVRTVKREKSMSRRIGEASSQRIVAPSRST